MDRRALSRGCPRRRRAPACLSRRARTGRAAHRPRERPRQPCGADQPAGRRVDPGETLADTALREAHEEIGVDPASVQVLGELTPVHVLISGFTLHPVVGVTHSRPTFSAGGRRGRRDPRGVARRPARRVADPPRHAHPRGDRRSSTPTSTCSATRSGARPRWCWVSSSAYSATAHRFHSSRQLGAKCDVLEPVADSLIAGSYLPDREQVLLPRM